MNKGLTILGVLLTHFLLSTGYVAYELGSKNAWPIHAIFVFLFLTALFVLIIDHKKIGATISNLRKAKKLRLALIPAVLFYSYFVSLLFGIGLSNAADIVLLMTVGLCINNIVSLYVDGGRDKSQSKKLEWSLVLFVVCLLIVVLLIKTKGDPGLLLSSPASLCVVLALLCDAILVFCRTTVCEKNNLDTGGFVATYIVLASVFSIGALVVDTLFITKFQQSIKYFGSYGMSTYMSWVFLALVPNLAQVILQASLERRAPILFHSLASTKFLFAAGIMLMFPELASSSLLNKPTPLTLSLIILLILLIILYNRHHQIAKNLTPR